MNKDQVKGHYKQAKGRAKETVGKAFGDKSLENEGKVDNISGKVQEGYGDLKEDIKDGS